MATCKCLNTSKAFRKLLSSFPARISTRQICIPVNKFIDQTARSSNPALLKQALEQSFTSSSVLATKHSNQWPRSITTSSKLSSEFAIVNTPPFAESITEGDVRWEKGVGDTVAEDEVVGEIETDKTSIPITATAAGVIVELFVEDGEKVEKGDKLLKIEVGAGSGEVKAPKEEAPRPSTPEPVVEKPPTPPPVRQATPSTPPPVAESPAGVIKVTKPTPPPPPPASQQPQGITQKEAKEAPNSLGGSREEIRVKMSRMRQRIAQRLKDAQNVNAMLTTFNEIDMRILGLNFEEELSIVYEEDANVTSIETTSCNDKEDQNTVGKFTTINIMEMRKQHKDAFLKSHGLKLGFMSAFTKASSYALQSMPVVNAVIEDGYIVYRDYVDISVAVATPKGLVVPVLRDVQSMNYLDIEKGINDLGEKARKGELAIEDMDGGTFTISNGGVFGSLMGTPIINPPQSAILGLHAINDRPVAVNGQVVIRPMMYVALTYDHRLVDGREAVTFLRKIKAAVEDPRIILLNL